MTKKTGVKNPTPKRSKPKLTGREKAIAAGKAKRSQYMKKK